ncbi:MAG TPA: chromate transporter [Xanthobacteraceae bacterium]|nr:chromate transporter [Xanthobacteraceae bacterium]
MREDASLLAALGAHFVVLSLLAIGGANAVIPEMHRQAVEVAGWMTDRQFADLFAIAQVAPGPNIIIVTLVGFHVAGVGGAVVATATMCGPSCLVAYFADRTWQRFQHARWRMILQAGMVPISVGLIAASALILARSADKSVVAFAMTAVTAGVTYFTRLHPLWMFALAAALGYAGLI